jgi:pyruvate dehydrogenase E2 component (dihydrolipoamide acetyltransferase)
MQYQQEVKLVAQNAIMPKWGLTMKEGKVTRWLKQEGESVQAGEALFEVETDKITNTVEAPASGVLFQIVVPAGDMASVQAVVGVIAEAGESPARVAAGTAAAAPAPKGGKAQVDAVPAGSAEFVPATPAARKLARVLAVDLEAVQGTGPGGRVTEKDVQAFKDSAPSVNASPQALEFATAHGIDLSGIEGTGPGGKITKVDILRAMQPSAAPKSATAAASAAPAAGATVIPMQGIRKLIADNMKASLNNAAQLSVFVEADVTAMVALRELYLARNRKNPDYRLSYNDIIAFAVCRALKKFPIMNSTQTGEDIHLHECVNLGVAVSLDNGLIVPNVKGADAMGLEALAAAVRDVAGRARKGGLTMDEISGGTFTISNVSMLGMDGFTPILNPPETGILGVGRVVEKPGVFQGEICIRKYMTLSLTFDHRVTDGAPAMSFLRLLADLLEQPVLMLA